MSALSGKRARYAGAALLAAGIGLAAAVQPMAQGGGEHEPQNLDVAKKKVEHFYGDRGDHQPSPTSPWANEVNAQVGRADQHLRERLAAGVANPAIVLDIDDTSETTYPVQAEHGFSNDDQMLHQAIRDNRLPAIAQTRDLANWAKAHGVRVFFITGRKEPLRQPTAAGLQAVGFPQPDGLFLKPTGKAPDYLQCGTHCTTVQYKAGTRAHLEQQGSTIIANLGDQFSDLRGGHSERSYKLPNPIYYIP